MHVPYKQVEAYNITAARVVCSDIYLHMCSISRMKQMLTAASQGHGIYDNGAHGFCTRLHMALLTTADM